MQSTSDILLYLESDSGVASTKKEVLLNYCKADVFNLIPENARNKMLFV